MEEKGDMMAWLDFREEGFKKSYVVRDPVAPYLDHITRHRRPWLSVVLHLPNLPPPRAPRAVHFHAALDTRIPAVPPCRPRPTPGVRGASQEAWASV